MFALHRELNGGNQKANGNAEVNEKNAKNEKEENRYKDGTLSSTNHN